jgi:hypothetical protein
VLCRLDDMMRYVDHDVRARYSDLQYTSQLHRIPVKSVAPKEGIYDRDN